MKRIGEEEPMDIDGTDDVIEVDDSKDILQERSQMWDEKIRRN